MAPAMTAEIPDWVKKRIEQNPTGLLADLFTLPGAREKSGRPATTLELWHAVDILKAHALHLQKRVETLESRGPEVRYRGVWREGNVANPGDFYTAAGSVWHCNEPTTAKPGTSAAWTLAVKRGADANPHEVAKRLIPEVERAITRHIKGGTP
jgi:hypothetical protein